jgi:succinate dehydrogenase hydrophobic anchor subunit
MQASDRIVYGRPFRPTPVWMWVMQRASGVLLGPLVLLHVWSPAMASNRAVNAVLLAFVLAHGFSGLRRMAVKRGGSGRMLVVASIWCAVVAFFGLLIVVSGA